MKLPWKLCHCFIFLSLTQSFVSVFLSMEHTETSLQCTGEGDFFYMLPLRHFSVVQNSLLSPPDCYVYMECVSLIVDIVEGGDQTSQHEDNHLSTLLVSFFFFLWVGKHSLNSCLPECVLSNVGHRFAFHWV